MCHPHGPSPPGGRGLDLRISPITPVRRVRASISARSPRSIHVLGAQASQECRARSCDRRGGPGRTASRPPPTLASPRRAAHPRRPGNAERVGALLTAAAWDARAGAEPFPDSPGCSSHGPPFPVLERCLELGSLQKRQRSTRKGHATVEADIGVLWPQPRKADDGWRPPEAERQGALGLGENSLLLW